MQYLRIDIIFLQFTYEDMFEPARAEMPTGSLVHPEPHGVHFLTELLIASSVNSFNTFQTI